MITLLARAKLVAEVIKVVDKYQLRYIQQRVYRELEKSR